MKENEQVSAQMKDYYWKQFVKNNGEKRKSRFPVMRDRLKRNFYLLLAENAHLC